MFLYGMMMRQSQNIWQWEKTNGVNRLLRNANNFTFFLKSFVPSLFCTFYFEVVPILFIWIVIEELSSIRSWTIIYALLNLSRSIYFQFSTNIYNVFRNSLICFSVFAIHDRKKYIYTLCIFADIINIYLKFEGLGLTPEMNKYVLFFSFFF